MKNLIFLIIICFLFSCKNNIDNEVKYETKYFKSIYLGDVSNNFMHCYKITVDSIEYIVVGNGTAVGIVKHQK